MHTLKRLGVLSLVGGAMFLSACGAKQGGSKALHAEWNDLYAAIPADAAWSFGLRTDADGEMSNLLGMTTESFSADGFSDIVRVLGRENQLNESEMVAFERKGSRWFIAEVEDTALTLEKLADHYRMIGSLEETRVGERVVLRHVVSGERKEGFAVDTTAVGRYVIARYGDSSDESAVAAEFVQLTKGWPTVGRYVQQGPGAAQRLRAEQGVLNAWAGLDVRALNQTLLVKGQEGTDPMAMLRTGDIDTSVMCQEANARIEALVPSVSFVAFTDADGFQHTDTFMALSQRGAESGKSLMPGAPSLERFAQRALAGVGVSFDYGKFLNGIQAVDGQSNCYGLAGAVGTLAEMRDDYSTSIQFSSRTVSGTGALVLESVNLDGFIPTAELGAMIHSPNATALMERIVRFARKYGSAAVDATASSPTITVQLTGLPVRLRIQRGDDRVIVSTGGLNEAITVGLMNTATHASGAPAMTVFTDGTRMTRLGAQANQYIEEMELNDSNVRALANALGGPKKSVRANLRFEADGLRFSSKQE